MVDFESILFDMMRWLILNQFKKKRVAPLFFLYWDLEFSEPLENGVPRFLVFKEVDEPADNELTIIKSKP